MALAWYWQVLVVAMLGLVSVPIARIQKPRFFWGSAMIDPTSLPWLIAFLLFGPWAALLSSLIGGAGIWLISPEPTPALGASLKFIGTTPVWLVPALAVIFVLGGGYPSTALSNPVTYLGLASVAAAVRIAIEVPLCYWAIPYYRSVVSGSRMGAGEMLEEFGGTGHYVAILAGFNLWLTLFDAWAPWLIVYPTGLAAITGL